MRPQPRGTIRRAAGLIAGPLVAMALLLARDVATAATGAYETGPAKIVNERTRKTLFSVGVSDLQRFTLIKKAVAARRIGRDMIADGMDLGSRYVARAPLFAGAVFGALIDAYDAAALQKDTSYADATYWNAVAYDTVCARDAELCQALAEIVFTDSLGSPFLKASLLRYVDYAQAVTSGWLSADYVADATEKCLAAHRTMADRATEEGRWATPPYRDHMRPDCDTPGAGSAIR